MTEQERKLFVAMVGLRFEDKLLLINKILDEGVDINCIDIDNDGATPLLYAIRIAGISQYDIDYKVFELLLSKGARLNVEDDEGNTPVLIAIKYFALNILDRLVQMGCSIQSQNSEGCDVFDIILARYLEEKKIDEEHIDTVADPHFKASILEGKGEAFERMLMRIDAILSHGYNLNSEERNSAAFTAVAAISANRLPVDVLEYLFDNGSDPKETILRENGMRVPLLDYAMFRKLPQTSILSLMQKIGLDYVFDDYYSFTPLDFAVVKGDISLLTQLIHLGASIHHNNDQPLRNACKLGNLEMVKFLISMGADTQVKDDKGNTASYYAQTKGFDKIVAYLKTK